MTLLGRGGPTIRLLLWRRDPLDHCIPSGSLQLQRSNAKTPLLYTDFESFTRCYTFVGERHVYRWSVVGDTSQLLDRLFYWIDQFQSVENGIGIVYPLPVRLLWLHQVPDLLYPKRVVLLDLWPRGLKGFTFIVSDFWVVRPDLWPWGLKDYTFIVSVYDFWGLYRVGH